MQHLSYKEKVDLLEKCRFAKIISHEIINNQRNPDNLKSSAHYIYGVAILGICYVPNRMYQIVRIEIDRKHPIIMWSAIRFPLFSQLIHNIPRGCKTLVVFLLLLFKHQHKSIYITHCWYFYIIYHNGWVFHHTWQVPKWVSDGLQFADCVSVMKDRSIRAKASTTLSESHVSFHVTLASLQWRHNEFGGVSNHQLHNWSLKRLFKPQIKENIKAPRHWPLCEDFTGDRWIPQTNGQ